VTYLKGALDYLLWYHLYEAASPSRWERTKSRLAKERACVMAGYRPSSTIPQTPRVIGFPTTAIGARCPAHFATMYF
jgi:hypothetical protein